MLLSDPAGPFATVSLALVGVQRLLRGGTDDRERWQVTRTETVGSSVRHVGWDQDEDHYDYMANDVRFGTEDNALFARYPKKVPFKPENLQAGDKDRFIELRLRLKELMELVASASPTATHLISFASLYSQNGKTPLDLWSCAFPAVAENKSYALQVAFIVSATGAEVTACLGAGQSTVQGPDKQLHLEQEFARLKKRLAGVPISVRSEVEQNLPDAFSFRRSWRQDGGGVADFQDLQGWLDYASGPDGAGAAISRNLTVAELDGLGDGVLHEVQSLLRAVTPLFGYCYGEEDDVTEPDSDAASDDALETAPPTVVAFDAASLRKGAVDRGLELDDDVYTAVAAAIKSGKHVLLTGPPGTGKTTLAEVMAELAVKSGIANGFLPTTATADWTTYETVGGLRPTDQQSLRFEPGLVLQALAEQRWLLIDELNRANFDRAFGPMFTVLSGHVVTLPYTDAQSGKPISIVPHSAAGPVNSTSLEILPVPTGWRIVGTMNVFDKSLLFEMSFALMRRFAFVEVASPNDESYRKLWRRELNTESSDQIESVLDSLLLLRAIKDIGPATFIDMAKFASFYISEMGSRSSGALAFQLFYSFMLPQFEGVDRQAGQLLFRSLKPVVGTAYHERLRTTLNTVLGLAVAAPAVSIAMDDARVDVGTEAE